MTKQQIKAAQEALASYYAGSVSASVEKDYQNGNVRTK